MLGEGLILITLEPKFEGNALLQTIFCLVSSTLFLLVQGRKTSTGESVPFLGMFAK
jgi:hypothetical protein